MPADTLPTTKCPRVRFRYSHASSRSARSRLKRALRGGFPSNSVVRNSLLPTVLGSVEINGEEYGVSFLRDRQDKSFLIVYVIPMSVVIKIPLRKSLPSYGNDIPNMLILCRCIDKTIRSIEGVDLVHWYFEWSDHRSKSVWTLDELSWDE